MNLKVIFIILIIAIACLIVCETFHTENSKDDADNSVIISNNSTKTVDYQQADVNLKKLWY